jgi:hypothetical protein
MAEQKADRFVPTLQLHFSEAVQIASLFAIVLFMWVGQAMADGSTAKESYSASKIISMLEVGAIAVNGSDQILRDEENSIKILRYENYTVFSIQGLDTADNITLISEGGRFFYAHYGSCSVNFIINSHTLFCPKPKDQALPVIRLLYKLKLNQISKVSRTRNVTGKYDRT